MSLPLCTEIVQSQTLKDNDKGHPPSGEAGQVLLGPLGPQRPHL